MTEKRTNRPGVTTTDRPPRGSPRGFGRGRFPRGGGYMPYISAPYRGRIARPYFRYGPSFFPNNPNHFLSLHFVVAVVDPVTSTPLIKNAQFQLNRFRSLLTCTK